MSISRFKAGQFFFVFDHLTVEFLGQRIDGCVEIFRVCIGENLGAGGVECGLGLLDQSCRSTRLSLVVT